MKKAVIVLIILVVIGMGGFFVYNNANEFSEFESCGNTGAFGISSISSTGKVTDEKIMVCCDGESKDWFASSKDLKAAKIQELCGNLLNTGEVLKPSEVGSAVIVNTNTGERTPLSEWQEKNEDK